MASLTSSLRILLISTAVLSGALVVKSSFPLLVDFSVYRAPVLWSSISSWLRPPYLYFVINCIIITIVATSRFHHHGHGEERPQKVEAAVAVVRPDRFDFDEVKVSDVVVATADARSRDFGAAEEERLRKVMDAESGVLFEDKKAVTVSGGVSSVEEEITLPAEEAEDEFVISRSAWIPPKKNALGSNSSENLLLEAISPAPAEKPLVSARFVHRKPVKGGTPEGGRALRRVSKPKRHDTLENTWKMITEGRPIPLTRHLKKSDTWENHGRHINVPDISSPGDGLTPVVKKSETFKDRSNQLPPLTPSPVTAGGERRLKKEPSLGQDELNRRVEAFINKFNEEMRMQRQESINRYKEMMISRGSNEIEKITY